MLHFSALERRQDNAKLHYPGLRSKAMQLGMHMEQASFVLMS